MAKIRDIIPKNELDILERLHTKDEIISIAKKRYAEQRALKLKQTDNQTQKQPHPKIENKFDDDSFSSGVVRGLAEASARGVAFADNVTNQFDLTKNLINDETASKNTKMLNHLEEVKQKTSRKGLSKERLAELEALEKESANAKGFWENAKVGGKQLWDLAWNLDEVTTQGFVAGLYPTDPANALSFATGGIGGKIATTTLKKIGFGIADGVGVNAFTEYNVAKGSGKSDDEAKKIALQSGVAGGVIPAAFATAGATAKVPKHLTNDEIAIKNNILKIHTNIKENLTDLNGGEIIDETTTNGVVDEATKENTTKTIETINEAEQTATQSHEQTKATLDQMNNEGATLDEMIAYKQNVPVSKADEIVSKIINDEELPSNDLAGFKIVNVIEDTIRSKALTPDEVYTKLREKNIKQPLAKIAADAYKERNTDILVDYISNKTAEYLQTTNENYKNQVLQKIDIHNKQIIADEKAWSSSLIKATLDKFIDKYIGSDFIDDNQKAMIYELNKLGLVQDLKSENIKAKLKENANGVYDKNTNEITIDNTMSKLDKAQTLTHEYIHSAITKLLHHKPFYDEMTQLMNEAKKQSKNKTHYGFTAPDEFIAEAFSDPYFAKELNDMKLTSKMKKRYGAKEHIQSVWDLIVDKFSEVVYLATGKKFKINKDSYFDALNKTLGKQIQELEQIKSDRIFNGESLKQTHNEKPKVIPATDFDNLKLHPRFDELMDMRKDIKASDIKYDKKVVQKGTVVHDKDKYGGVDNTFVVPTSYEKNYNADFVLTKQDIKNIKDGKINDEIVAKIEQDLHTLDNNPDYMIAKDVDIVKSKEILGDEFNNNYYVNKQGELIKDGELLFSKSKTQAEQRGIYNVTFNNKLKTMIQKSNLKDIVQYEKGNRKYGAKHIIRKHFGDGKVGELTKKDILEFGNIIRNGEINPESFRETKNGISYVYELKKDNHILSVAVEETNNGEKILSGFSDKNLSDWIKKDDGTTLGQPSSLDKEIIPQKTKKNQGLKNGNIKNKTRDNQNLGSTTKRNDSATTTNERKPNSSDDGADTLFSRATDELSTKDKSMEGQSTTTDTSSNFHKFDTDEVVSTKAKTFKEIKEKSLWQKYEDSVDRIVDTVFEKALMGGLEKLSIPLKIVADGMTVGKFDIKHKNWFNITDTQKAINEVINDFNALKTDIYQIANEIKNSLENLTKTQSKDLLKVLNADMKLKELSDDIKPLYKTFRYEIDKNANELVKLGILKEDEKIKDYVKRYYKKYLEDSGQIKAIKSKAFAKFYKRKDLDYDTRVKLGMIEDAGVVIANTIAEQKNLIAKAKVLKTIADKWGVDKEIDGYVRISDESVKDGVKKWGALAGKYVPQEIKKELLQSRVIASELRYWEDVQYALVDHIKVNVTVKNPATHIYNIGSNISLSFIAGDMVALGKTLKMMVSKPNEFKALVKRANKLGLDSMLDDIENPMLELHKNSKKTNIALTIAKNLYMTQDSKIGKNIRKLYDWGDKIFKLARFKKLIDKGMSEKEAFADAMATYVDYRTPVPAGIRWLDKGGFMPFLHYQYKAAPQVAKIIAKNPIKAMILGTGIASIGGLRWQDEDDKYYKPNWADNKLIGNQFFTKEWVKVGNSGYYWNIGRLIPGTKFDFDFGGFMKGLLYIEDGRSPLGYEVIKDGEDYEYAKKLQLLTKNYTPPLTFGRYGQRIIDIGLSKAGIKEAPKNPVNKKPDTLKDVALRGVGIRQFDEKKEFKKHYKKAKKENDTQTLQKMEKFVPSFDLGSYKKSSSNNKKIMPKFDIKF